MPKKAKIDLNDFVTPPKPKKTKKDLRPLESESEEEVEEQPREKEEVDTEQPIQHPCAICQKIFKCKDGKYKTIKGKQKFKCSCPLLRQESDLYFFCSKKCAKKANDPESEEEDGYISV